MPSDTTKRRDGIPPLPDLGSLPPDGGPEFNRLVFSTSPYLLQHARNPVDWFPWGEDAFLLARAEDRPIFLSIGYSTCHWCHVMEHESFEDEEVAAFLNRNFVAIKVDREERPDIDSVFMTFCHATTGSGGWPLSIFLTPDRRPFFAGTYFPREPRFGHPGFLDLLTRLNELWHTERGKVTNAGAEFVRAFNRPPAASSGTLTVADLDRAVEEFKGSFDHQHAGFGQAPKFPMAHNLGFLLRRFHATNDADLREMVQRTLKAMAHGGLYDQLGFGFCRYSVDATWLVPHFEKMLYDNALLLLAYADGWQISQDSFYSRIAREVATYLERDLQSPEGGFWSAENADSEGVEGKFYVFTREELLEILGPTNGPLIAEFLGVTAKGNFEDGQNILHHPVELGTFAETHGIPSVELATRWEEAREKLFAARSKRIHPSLDDKILTSWNGLAIAALARTGSILGDQTMVAAARKAADFLLSSMVRPDNRLYRSWRAGQAHITAFLEDYAFVVWGLIELYQATFEARYLERALAFHQTMLDDFLDRATGLLFLSSRDGEPLFMRPLESFDGALPSGHSAGALNSLRLARLTGKPELETIGARLLDAMSDQVESHPSGFSLLLTALDFAREPGQEIVLSGPSRGALEPYLNELRKRFLPRMTVHLLTADAPHEDLVQLIPFLEPLRPAGDRISATFCTGSSCSAPIGDLATFISRLEATTSGAPLAPHRTKS